jgi:hypothetical protein
LQNILVNHHSPRIPNRPQADHNPYNCLMRQLSSTPPLTMLSRLLHWSYILLPQSHLAPMPRRPSPYDTPGGSVSRNPGHCKHYTGSGPLCFSDARHTVLAARERPLSWMAPAPSIKQPTPSLLPSYLICQLCALTSLISSLLCESNDTRTSGTQA